jgi:UDP-N-acetylmuramoyl-tripeptide--D-alanyl-D-alanine ligase
MQHLQTFLRPLNVLFPLRDFLYILQLEDYRTDRYIYWLPRFFFRRNIEVRQHLVLTARVLLLAATTIAVTAIILAASWLFLPILLALIASVAIMVNTPLIVLVAHVCSLPLFSLMHNRVQRAAAALRAARKDLTVVLIVGSFGKTTVRNYLYEMVRLAHKTQTLPGNVNSEAGVAAWMLTSLKKDTSVLIVESDTYAIGEIARMCAIVRPTISVITALGDQHMVRLKHRHTLIEATAEAFTKAEPGARCIAHSDVWNECAAVYAPIRDARVRVDADSAPQELSHDLTPVLEQHAPTTQRNILIAAHAACLLDVPARFIIQAAQAPLALERRQTRTTIYGYECLDDSYNITLTTARASLSVAKAHAHAANKKLLVVVAGIPEAEHPVKENTELGKACAAIADHTIILKSMYEPELRHGFAHHAHQYTLGESVRYEILEQQTSTFPPSEWFVLLLPGLTDLFY